MKLTMGSAAVTCEVAFAGEVDEKTHLLGCQYSARSYAGSNCLLVPVPTTEISAAYLLPTQHMPDLMENLAASVPGPVQPNGDFEGAVLEGYSPITEHSMNDVVFVPRVADIKSALEEVDPAKRPMPNHDLLAWLDEMHGDLGFMLACFGGGQQTYSFLLQYRPANPNTLFVPGLELHYGQLWMGAETVTRNQKIVFGSRLAAHSMGSAQQVHYANDTGGLRSVLPAFAVGFYHEGSSHNGHYWADVEDVRAGVSGEELLMQAHTT